MELEEWLFAKPNRRVTIAPVEGRRFEAVVEMLHEDYVESTHVSKVTASSLEAVLTVLSATFPIDYSALRDLYATVGPTSRWLVDVQ